MPRPSDRGHALRKDIEGMRAIAVLAVMLYHAGVPFFEGGFVGVDVFFVISGFLITGQLLRDGDLSPATRIRQFYARRIRRIMPAATLTILGTWLGAALLQQALLQGVARDDGIAAMFFYANIRFAGLATDYFHEGAAPSLFQHFWSLSLEEQFYFVWPALLIAAALVWKQRHAMPILVGLIGVASFALGVRLTKTSPEAAFFLLPAAGVELCLGAGLAMVGTTRIIRNELRPSVRILGLLAIAVAILRFSNNTPYPGTAALLPVIGAALVIAAGTAATPVHGGAFLSFQPMQWIGRYSYSLYLWHWPALMLADLRYDSVSLNWKKALVVLAVSAVPCAIASYHLVEHPTRTYLTRRRDGASILTGAALLAFGAVAVVPYNAALPVNLNGGGPATAAPSGQVTPSNVVPSNLAPSLVSAFRFEHDDDFAPCHRVAADKCVTGDLQSTRTVVLYGDSHARHWIPAFDEVGRQNHWKVVNFAESACPSFIEPPTRNPAKCKGFRRNAVERIRALKPELVVFSNQSYGYFAQDPAGFDRGLREALEQVRHAAGRVAVLAQTPASTTDIAVCLSNHLKNTKACDPPFDLAAMHTINERARAAVGEIGGGFIDAVAWTCANERCPSVIGNMLVYRDRNHFTPEFTRWCVPMLAAVLERLVSPSN